MSQLKLTVIKANDLPITTSNGVREVLTQRFDRQTRNEKG